MRVALFGAAGQLGIALTKSKPENIELLPLTLKDVDITDRAAVLSKLDSLKPEVIINAAAYTQVDKAEEEVDLAYAVNANGPENMALWVKENGGRLIHISTDFVFDGKKKRPYVETDTPNPLNVYGKSKLEGEKRVQAIIPDHSVIVRTSWLYSNEGVNFYNTILRLLEERDTVNVVADQIGSPTRAGSLAKVLWKVVVGMDIAGIYHWANQGEVSWYEFAQKIKEKALSHNVLQSAARVNAIKTEEFVVKAERPGYSVLDCSKLGEQLKCEADAWIDGLDFEVSMKR